MELILPLGERKYDNIFLSVCPAFFRSLIGQETVKNFNKKTTSNLLANLEHFSFFHF